MADEMLGAVEHPVVAILHGGRLHAAQVGAGARLGHRQAVPFLAADAGEQIFFALLRRAGQQDVGGTRHAGPVQRVIGAAEFLLVEQPGHRIEPGAADIGRHVGGIEPGLDRLDLDLLDQFAAQHAGALHLLLMRIKLVLDERARRLDDEFLLLRQAEIHGLSPSSFSSACRLSSPACSPWPFRPPWRRPASSPPAWPAAWCSPCAARRRPSPCPCSASTALP